MIFFMLLFGGYVLKIDYGYKNHPFIEMFFARW